ncbi:hypothetical protein BCR33DRAFT_63339 [Rhizoclosmatium globosum]|uniref:ABC-type glycine betaine transport system substrate-binding domain-containing protein n=1 Tax=Rhizoclosmatium globosum TaxID=329046 RepID=A0A1Y2CMS9_9FUNG|nr:hypothetical protein BCR33DRAFT_63339 [Rhizoclosmatium globosum]|eukprot:ORY48267.1 hypothetical protein BCR33DRAFT_63339 [Rhizoclosmatium globosum]
MMLYFSKILLATPYGHLTSTDLHSDKNLHQREVLYSPPQIDPPRISNSMVAFIVMGFLLWTHAVMADFNWTAYNMDSNNSKFYNAPPCPLASNNLGWNALKNQDGTYYTTNKRPVVIMYDSWDSAQLNAFLGQYILEAMGYRVQMVQRINYELGIEFYNDVVDLEFEIWLQDLGASFKQITQTDKVALNLGAIGYNGNYGLYIPSYLLDDHPDWNLDFFRFLYNPLHTSIFPASGTGPRLIINGQPLCDDLPGLCINATYTPPQCKPPSTRRCIELFHYDPSFATGIFQRMIDGLDLPVTLTFLGASTAEGFFREALQRREAVFMMAIVPTVFAADANLTRVLFPGNNPTQYAAFLKDSSVPLTTEPQSSLLQKLGSRRFSRDFPELETLFTKYLLPEDQINLMLKNMAVNGWTTRESSCDWFKKSQDVWGTWIPPVPKSVGEYHLFIFGGSLGS